MQPENAFLLRKWSGDDKDRTLIDLAAFLKSESGLVQCQHFCGCCYLYSAVQNNEGCVYLFITGLHKSNLKSLFIKFDEWQKLFLN